MARVRDVEHGLSPDAVSNIRAESIDGFDGVDTLIRDYAVLVTNQFQYIRDRIFKDLRVHFSDAQIIELTLRIALCGFFNRFNDSLQIATEGDAIAEALALGITSDGPTN
ncbi:hypothetical protein HBA54_17425 [Pelagibius litoralis]|uniref:Carboxymuconolactone decarboxylase family protein n=1 Tax=Pelagibius litoralis TaxID=374515 RepID=A0A967EZR6_9PROT|nr:hypothetical protein [Pelagibius litoralis]NIA70388.1 hypothetical protein [Pelagibius litoralis]